MTVIRFRPGRFDPPVVRVIIEPATQSYPPDDEIRLLDDPPKPEPEPLPVVTGLPGSVSTALRDEVVEVSIPADDAPNWAWRFILVYDLADRYSSETIRHVPDSTDPLEYDELVVLDDYTLQPDPADVPLWRNVVDQVVVLQAVTVQAAQSAIGSAQAAGAASADAASQAEQAAAVARRIITTSVTWDPVPIAAGSYTSALVNWADVELGHMIGIAPMTDIGNGVQVYAIAQAAGRVRLTIRNLTGSALDLPATTFRLYRIQVPV